MLKPSLQLKLSQQLTMTPQLQQAIRLLQLPVMELQTQIQTALDENVMLEVEESETAAEDGQAESASPDSDEPEDFTDGDAEPEVAVAAEADWEDTQKTGPSEAPKSADDRIQIKQGDPHHEQDDVRRAVCARAVGGEPAGHGCRSGGGLLQGEERLFPGRLGLGRDL